MSEKMVYVSVLFMTKVDQFSLLDGKVCMRATIQTTIKIRIHKSVMDRVLDYCTYEHFSPNGDEHYIVSFPFIENEYNYNILFSFGDKCECLEPLHIRTEMKRRIHDIAALYEK